MRKGSFVVALTLMGAPLLCSSASTQSYSHHDPGAQVDVGVFYENLAPYGDWVDMPDYGWSWAPRVAHDWRPYTRGQWILTDDGWFWDSDEPFGWATYHYGRWVDDRDYGWLWVPGTEWAPAWVSWRHGNGYTGWAPLPPRATWRTNVGLSIGGLEIDALLGERDYAFVPDRAFVDRGVYQRVLPFAQNGTFLKKTTNVTKYTFANRRVVNGGIAVANVQRAVGRSVPRARTVDSDWLDSPRSTKAGEVAVFRPEVKAAPEKRPAQGKRMVKGEEPPALLVERHKQQVQVQQQQKQKGDKPGLTAKDAQQVRAQKQSSQAKSNQKQADQQRAQQASAAKAQTAERVQAAQQGRAQKQTEQSKGNQRQLKQQHAQQAGDAQQAQAGKRAHDAQREPKAAAAPPPAKQQAAPAENGKHGNGAQQGPKDEGKGKGKKGH